MSKSSSSVNAHELEAFHHEVEQHLGVRGEIVAFGVSRTLRLDLRGRHVEVGTNGSYLWVTADLRWDAFPESALLTCAPEGSYNRAKALEDGTIPAKTGDPSFDQTYLLLGGAADAIAAALTPQARRVLLEFADLRPELQGTDFGADPPKAARRVHLRCEPDLRLTGHGSSFVRLGAERFTPEHAVGVAERLTACAERLEAALS